MSLLTICQNVANQSGFSAPATIFGNSNDLAKRLKALASLEGRTLAKKHNWVVLQKEHTFSTTSGEDEYALPSDFSHFIPTTMWDRSEFWAMQGPMTPDEWQTLKSGIISTWPRIKFRILPVSGTKTFVVLPEPTSTVNLVYEYVSDAWCRRDVDSVLVNDWSADDDEAIISEYLIELGVRWRLLNALGLPYAEERAEYDREVGIAIGRDGGSRILNQSKNRIKKLNVPEQGYGV